MSEFEVRVQIEGEEVQRLLSVPVDMSIEAMVGHVGCSLGVEAIGLADGGNKLPLADLLADYWEPDRVFTLNLKRGFGPSSLLWRAQDVVEGFGIRLKNAELAIFAEGPFAMDDFWKKVGDAAPTLLLLETTTGIRCGGFAAVPWPDSDDEEDDAKDQTAVDDAKASFLFSLGAKPRRFNLTDDTEALRTYSDSWAGFFQFGGQYSLCIDADGSCQAEAAGGYKPDPWELVGADDEPVPYRRWELWRL
jgi:hypothetical protein